MFFPPTNKKRHHQPLPKPTEAKRGAQHLYQLVVPSTASVGNYSVTEKWLGSWWFGKSGWEMGLRFFLLFIFLKRNLPCFFYLMVCYFVSKSFFSGDLSLISAYWPIKATERSPKSLRLCLPGARYQQRCFGAGDCCSRHAAA